MPCTLGAFEWKRESELREEGRKHDATFTENQKEKDETCFMNTFALVQSMAINVDFYWMVCLVLWISIRANGRRATCVYVFGATTSHKWWISLTIDQFTVIWSLFEIDLQTIMQ